MIYPCLPHHKLLKCWGKKAVPLESVIVSMEFISAATCVPKLNVSVPCPKSLALLTDCFTEGTKTVIHLPGALISRLPRAKTLAVR